LENQGSNQEGTASKMTANIATTITARLGTPSVRRSIGGVPAVDVNCIKLQRSVDIDRTSAVTPKMLPQQA